jgi:phospholipase C
MTPNRSDPIEHIVVLMLENNSFDRMLGTIPGVEGVNSSIPRSNPDFPSSMAILASATAERKMAQDPEHELDDVLRQIAGPCQGFVSDFAQHYPQTSPEQRAEIMGYFEHGFLRVLHTLADSYAVCDHWFSSLPGPTWPNRFFVHSGTSLGRVRMPNGTFLPDVHLYDQPTVYQRLSERNVDWAIYYGDFPQSIVMTKQWAYLDRYHGMQEFHDSVHGPANQFPEYAFIEPIYFGAGQNDQHPLSDILAGEALIASVYNSILQNDDLWRKTLLVLLYDEHGGFYDHVDPPHALPPDEHTEEFAFNQYGPRVPAILISPWIDHQIIQDVFDHTSLLKYLSDKWSLGPLGARVANAQSFERYLLRRQKPRGDAPGPLPIPVLMPAEPSPGLNANQNALVSLGRFLEVKIADAAGETAAALEEIGQRLVSSMKDGSHHPEVAVQRLQAFLHLRST